MVVIPDLQESRPIPEESMSDSRDDLLPTRLEQQPDGSLLIEWNDGHQTILALHDLRLGCPCAACREERENNGSLRVDESGTPNRFRIRKLEHVGRYAISVVWGDGHSTGIYSWPILRGLCSCFQCRLDRGEV
jgi:DUF971 family protein